MSKEHLKPIEGLVSIDSCIQEIAKDRRVCARAHNTKCIFFFFKELDDSKL